MLNTEIKYTYNDVTIVPCAISDINSRSECNPYVNGKLPIFAAPMASVIGEDNIQTFIENNITPILPRTINISSRIKYMEQGIWVAMSLNEFNDEFVKHTDKRIRHNIYNICIDVANGHMKQIYDSAVMAKNCASTNNYTLTIMTGNIANPETYEYICKINAEISWLNNYKVIDYIRCGIGSGAVCITSPQTGVHYPMASLIDECKQIKRHYRENTTPYIVADGGIRNYGDINKALALGADFVMVGTLFAGMLESASPLYEKSFNELGNTETTLISKNFNNEEDKRYFLNSYKKNALFKECFGMSTKKAQEQIKNDKKLKTSEGIQKLVPCTYTLKQWVENMESYLRSAMSYCGCYNIDEFNTKANLIVVSDGVKNSVNK